MYQLIAIESDFTFNVEGLTLAQIKRRFKGLTNKYPNSYKITDSKGDTVSVNNLVYTNEGYKWLGWDKK